ncbi:nagB [Symbiodinium pilosum]|uniref:NagB protein n=1 Tax=Symbiodinium pilosum TaxID=2952 RepID=A0A812UMK7_SYMPI|nr:nagB [Symbiodinium pilosum]
MLEAFGRYFIKWVQRILQNWTSADIQEEARKFGLQPDKPKLDKLTFVQIDEFYPISPDQHNSFYHYVSEYYIKGFGLDPKRALLMDCSKIGLDLDPGYGPTGEPRDYVKKALNMEDVWPTGEVDLSLRTRDPSTRQELLQQRVLRQVDQWCAEYEAKIRALGGIGFFMGGIGPDGHIAFNCQGCDHFATTRLDQLNYASQAAAAGDLGGIETVRRRKVITIGLGTIAYNPDCVALICAAGEAKAQVVRNAVQEASHVNYPATALHQLPSAAFFVTTGAAKLLERRQLELLERMPSITPSVIERVLVSLSGHRRKKLVDLSEEDLASCPLASCAVRKSGRPLQALAEEVKESLISKIEQGCRVRENTKFLHTEPHHDDIMLGYLPAVMRNTRVSSNQHHFVCATSGFNSVSNAHMLKMLARVESFLATPTFQRLAKEGYFSCGPESLDFRRRDVWKFLDGIAAADDELRDEGAARRLVYNLTVIFGDSASNGDPSKLLARVATLKSYFTTQYAGQKDVKEVQTLKGACREFEAECVWGYIGWQLPNISHLRLGFYTADIFAPEPTQQRDVLPILKLLREVEPHVVSVALDPEASGPDTHYKVLQAATAALQQYAEETGREDITVWGYRNVWFRFEPHEVSSIIPVSLQTISTLNHMFLSSFESQRDAEFPAYEIQGPFCAMSQRVQVQQYDMIETCLGYEWFHKHPSPLIRAARGLVFLREMSVQALLAESRALRQQTENI